MRTLLRNKFVLVFAFVLALCLGVAVALWAAPAAARADDGIDTEEKEIARLVSYNRRQVISYGQLLSDVLDNTATVEYTDGSTGTAEIEFGDIVANTGVNVNFTTTDITGVIKGTDIEVTVAVTTMPDDLVYFINCGSMDRDGKYVDTADPYFDYNNTLFAYYKDLINKVPDQSSSNSDTWGCYTSSTWTAPGDSTFPYNSLRWTEDAVDMGYYLTGLQANGSYRIWIGTLSHWHGRTVTITFNGAIVGADILRIDSSKGFSVYENVTADGNGKINLHMQGANTNEPCINFIAVQPMEIAVQAAPSALTAAPTIGMEDTSVTFTGGMQEGAKIQLYNAAKPNQVLYEEAFDPNKVQPDGSYTVDWGYVMSGLTQINAVQITNGGVSKALLISITDIENFSALLDNSDYTTGAVTVTVRAQARSGIVAYSYQSGQFGEVHTVSLDRPFAIAEKFTVTENGDYIIVVTSGLGVTYSETVQVQNISPDTPVISIVPSKRGWVAGEYNLSVTVNSVAPVTEYVLYKNGAQLAAAATAPSTVALTDTGEYTVFVKNAAGRTAARTLNVSGKPTVAKVTRKYENRTLTYMFEDNDDYAVASVSAYRVADGTATRMTIATGNAMDVYEAGTYVVTVTSKNGAVEMFSLDVTTQDLRGATIRPADSGVSKGVALGVGLGVGLGGAALAAAAVAVTFVLLKKKPAAQKEEQN